jgi:nucleotide-binding universal stress UspA family protein
MYKRILVATDGSRLSAKAVGSAIAMAKLCGAELLALNVVPRYPQSYFEGSLPLSAAEVGKIEAQWAGNAQAVVDQVVAKAGAAGVKGRGVVAKSDLVAEAIVAAARKHKAELVVMASHGRKGIKRLLLGSETQHVLTHSPTPVLVLR